MDAKPDEDRFRFIRDAADPDRDVPPNLFSPCERMKPSVSATIL
jgi:hypothetical protein